MDLLTGLTVFTRVAERASFARAADELDISRAAASGHVAALERHYGLRLLNRTTRRVSLTSEGADLLQRSQRILVELRDVDETLRGARSRPQGALRVDVPTAFGEHLLLPALPEFVRRYPSLELELRFNDRVVDLIADRIDVALRVGPIPQSGFATRRVGQMRLVTCASPRYLEKHGEPATPDELREHRLIGMISPGTGGAPEWNFPAPYSARRLKLAFALKLNSATAVVQTAAADLGIVRTADLLVADHVSHGRLRLILHRYSQPGPAMSLIYPSAGHQSAKVRVFSDFAADLLRRYSDLVRGAVPEPAPVRQRSR